MPPVRLLTLSSLFPNSLQPRYGIFVANRLQRLCETGRVVATVVAPIARFPGCYRANARVPDTETIQGFPVAHPRYLHVPGLGMRMQPDMLARSVLKYLDGTGTANRYDVIDAHYFYPDGVAAARVAAELGLPLVISARGSDINLIGDIAFARHRMVQAAERAQALIAVSRALAARMTELGMPPERTHVLRNGVDTARFAPSSRDEARRRAGVDPNSALVLGVGNLVAEKGFDLLIRAVARLPDVRLLIIGEGRMAQPLRVLAASLAEGRVELRPSMPQRELRFIYAAADVLALPSVREGWPNVLLESLACGTPVVASSVGGVPEIVCSDAAGVLLHTRDERTWADAIDALLRVRLARETVRAHAMQFEWDEIVARQCALYEDVARRHLPAAHGASDRAVSHA